MQEVPKEKPPDPKGATRREFLKTAWGAAVFAAIYSGNTKEAAALVEEEINPETTNETPRISIEIFYGPHATSEDLGGFKERVKSADVVIPEAIGWTEDDLKKISLLAKGEITPDDLLLQLREDKDSAHGALFDALYKSQKTIMIFDLPEGHDLNKALDAVDTGLDLQEPLPSIIQSLRKNLKTYMEIQLKREDYFIKKLLEFKEAAVKGQIPETKDKKEIKILIFWGAMHTRVYHKLKESGDNVTRNFSTMPFIYGPYSVEIMRRIAFGKETGDDLFIRSIFDSLTGSILDRLLKTAGIHSSHDIGLFTRKLVEAFSIDEIKTILEKMRTSENAGLTFVRLFAHALIGKKIYIPRTKEEFGIMLKRKHLGEAHPKKPERN